MILFLSRLAVFSLLHHLSINQQLHQWSENQRALHGCRSELVCRGTQVLETELLNADNPQVFFLFFSPGMDDF